MKNLFFVALSAILFSGCTSTSQVKSEPEFVWGHTAYQSQIDSGKITLEQARDIYNKDISECTGKTYQIQIPAPSCYSMPAQDCSEMTGFALGMCRGNNINPAQKCDYSAVNQAKADRKNILENCMIGKNWYKKYVQQN